MKTPENALIQWVSNQIEFDDGVRAGEKFLRGVGTGFQTASGCDRGGPQESVSAFEESRVESGDCGGQEGATLDLRVGGGDGGGERSTADVPRNRAGNPEGQREADGVLV